MLTNNNKLYILYVTKCRVILGTVYRPIGYTIPILRDRKCRGEAERCCDKVRFETLDASKSVCGRKPITALPQTPYLDLGR